MQPRLRVSRHLSESRGQHVSRHCRSLPLHPAQQELKLDRWMRCQALPELKTIEDYHTLYQQSIDNPAKFWADAASEFHWSKRWKEDHHSHNFDVRKGPIQATFFQGGETNMSYNCLDRHVLAGHGDSIAFLFEGNDVGREKAMTYKEVLAVVSKLSNWLKSRGVKKGDVVAIYMPMVCQLPIAMLACARIGAIHSVVFGGFSDLSLSDRITAAKAKVLLTCTGSLRGTKPINLKKIADKAVKMASANGHVVDSVLVYENDRAVPPDEAPLVVGRDFDWETALATMSDSCSVEWVESEHPLFILYTSGSTGKPKGIVHSTGGLMVYSATTAKYVFRLERGDVYFCTADCGWITGHSYLTYGPMLCGATNVVFEGVPTHPTPARLWDIVGKYRVKQLYTAPTALRSLMRMGDEWVTSSDRSSLQVLGSVGEPINPEAHQWYSNVVGEGRCPIADTWWQTETGGHMLTPLTGASGQPLWEERPGSATLPFFGVVPAILDKDGKELEGEAEGVLVIKKPWPSTARTVFGDHKRYEESYFSTFPSYYFTGDGARRDKDGYYWITGRVDDVINVSGHRIGTAEVEAALQSHPKCAEAAVVGYPHNIKGEGIYAYVTLMGGLDHPPLQGEALKKELISIVRSSIGAFAAPDVIHWAPGLPKTRSGKIMRRILRKIGANEEDQLGDISTLADPSVVSNLISLRGK